MERELKKLNNNDTGTSDGVDAQISGRDTDGASSPENDKA
tara:strand:+ start:740 stop:859 length:120 start_codon:yes stop_codon:yes gene_type:complete